ncbi:MAG: class I SAM-dependent methyltransferase [Halolamina sp.]
MTPTDRPTSATADPERTRHIQANYARWARIYDWCARVTVPVGGVRSGCISALDLAPGDTVVEFGCGPGVNLSPLRERVGPSGHVVGVDITGRMLDRARALVARRGWENVSLVQADATTAPIAAADAVLATFVTSLFPDPYTVVSEWCGIADTVVVANFAPRGNRVANAALWGLTQVNAELFDASGADALAQLEERTSASRRALADCMDTVDSEQYVLGTITVNAGRR